MPRIRVLDETLANQIAAGEVIERPAAVVKELVENALDAGARHVEIELLDGGRKLVRVRDDGVGMEREDARLSLQRHATSKLRSKEDLFAIASYGFRGEALPSIAAVSRFTLLTCEPGALAGTRIEVEGGALASLEDAGAPSGTTIEVRDLFWNVPARRKFVKRAATEQAWALEAVLRLAIPRLEVGFTLREGERTLLRLLPDETLEQRGEEALGRELRGRWLPFEHEVRGIRAHGLAGSPDISHGSARSLWIFVNGRAVRDRNLMHAALRAYGGVLPHGRYPAALIFLEVPAAEVDVNVHPAKAEVRLADPRAAYEAIAHGLGGRLGQGDRPGVSTSQGVPATRSYALTSDPPAGGESALDAARVARVAEAISRFGARPQRERPWEPFAAGARGDGRAQQGGAGAAPEWQPALLAPTNFFAGLGALGQLHESYLVCAGPGGLVLIDLHAAQERVLYRRLRRAAERPDAAQPLLVPRVLSPAPGAAARLVAAALALASCGLEIEDFGAGTIALKKLPLPLLSLGDGQLVALLADLAEEFEAHGCGGSAEGLRDALLARAACHASVRARDPLASEEAQALLDALDDADHGSRCAHGRLVVVEWGMAEIERRFGRDDASRPQAVPPGSSS